MDVLATILQATPATDISQEDGKDAEETPQAGILEEEAQMPRLPEYLNRFRVCNFFSSTISRE